MSWAIDTAGSASSWVSNDTSIGSPWDEATGMKWDDITTGSSFQFFGSTWDSIGWKVATQWSLYNAGSDASWANQSISSSSYQTLSSIQDSTWEVS